MNPTSSKKSESGMVYDAEDDILATAEIPDNPAQPADGVAILGEESGAKLIEYAPGQYAAVLGRETVPRYGIVRFDAVGKGEFRPRLVGWGKMISLRKFFRPKASGAEPHPLMQRLGLDLSYNSVLRLYKNGFIRGCMPVPHRILIDIESLNRHLQEASDPDYWTDERTKQFKETIY